MIVGETPNSGVAIYDPKTNILVIRDLRPNATQAGTVFEPEVPDLPKYLEGKIPVRGPLAPGSFADGPLPAPPHLAPKPPPLPEPGKPPPLKPPRLDGVLRAGGFPSVGAPGTPLGPTSVPPPHGTREPPLLGEADPD